jgi:hypothetical protein
MFLRDYRKGFRHREDLEWAELEVDEFFGISDLMPQGLQLLVDEGRFGKISLSGCCGASSFAANGSGMKMCEFGMTLNGMGRCSAVVGASGAATTGGGCKGWEIQGDCWLRRRVGRWDSELWCWCWNATERLDCKLW